MIAPWSLRSLTYMILFSAFSAPFRARGAKEDEQMTYSEYIGLRQIGRDEPDLATDVTADSSIAHKYGLTQNQLSTIMAAQTIKQICCMLHITQRQLSIILDIPLPTVEAWCAPDDSVRHRTPPKYLVDIILYCLVT